MSELEAAIARVKDMLQAKKEHREVNYDDILEALAVAVIYL